MKNVSRERTGRKEIIKIEHTRRLRNFKSQMMRSRCQSSSMPKFMKSRHKRRERYLFVNI